MNIEQVIETIHSKKLIRRYIVLIIALFLSACVFNLLLLPTKLVTGGVGGITIITKYLYGWNPAIITFVLSGALLLLSFLYLGVEKTSGSIVATLIYPVFVHLTEDIGSFIIIDMSDLLLISIFIGAISGVLNGIIFKVGFSNGGLQIISQILFKYFNIPVSKSSFIINMIVVLIGGFFFGFAIVMYAMIILFITSLLIDRVLLGISNNKAFYIITSKEEEVKEYIINHLNHSVTVFDVKGGFLQKRRKVLLTVVPSREYFQVTTGIKMLDSDAFFLACDAYQVEGGK